MADLQFSVPMIPPSVNSYVRHTRNGRHYITKAAKAFKAAIPICAKHKQVRHKYYAIEIYVILAPGQKIDLDNCAKVILDGLVEGGQIHSDAAVTLLCLHKRRDTRGPCTQVTIWKGREP